MRRRPVPHDSEDRLEAEIARIERQLARLRGGSQKEEQLQKIKQLETAPSLNKWLSRRSLDHRRSRRPAAMEQLKMGIIRRVRKSSTVIWLNRAS